MTTVPVPDKVEFLQYHRPNLEAGSYNISVTQQINANGNQDSYTATLNFAVQGERFTIDSQEIQAVFPPDGSLGDHSNVIPHLIMTRSTLPWERSAIRGNDHHPWLALLLFSDQEKPTLQSITLSELKNTGSYLAKYPSFDYEPGQAADDRVAVIDVPRSVLENLLPSLAELSLLTHVRQGLNSFGQSLGNEMATVMGKRLPAQGRISTVHLVSLEDRYTDGGFDFQGAGNSDTIRLVTLKSWSFACVDEKQSFSKLLTNLIPNSRTLSTLRLPHNSNADAETFLSQGLIPLQRHKRTGQTDVAWYRSPLIPGDSSETVSLPVLSADSLVKTHPHDGLQNVAYAAAWELGRLLTLNNQRVATAIYNWKRRTAQSLKQDETQILHLPLQPTSTEGMSDDQKTALNWFRDLSLLKNVPFNYLAPDHRALPEESIRFFQVDKLWVDCLLDGAFSIGRVSEADRDRDHGSLGNLQGNTLDKLSGFLLRSDVVPGWPHLQIEGYATVHNDTNNISEMPLQILRLERFTPTMLFCLFSGQVQTVDIHQRPETMHFGVDTPTNQHPHLHKYFRDNNGNISRSMMVSQLPWQSQNRRIINMATLASEGQASTGDLFALRMLEGVQKVRFIKQS